MAKRKKSKKQPKSDQVAEATASDSNETAAPAGDEAVIAESPIAAAPESTAAEEIPSQGVTGPLEPEGETVPAEAAYAAPWVEDAAPSSADPPPADDAAAPWAEDAAPSSADPLPADDATAAWAEDAAPSSADPLPADDAIAAWAEDAAPSDAGTPLADTATPAQNGGEGLAEGLVESRLESIIESLLFASDKPLGLAELKRLLGERDGKKISAAMETLFSRRKGEGVEVVALSSGWHLRTNPENADWVGKLLVGRPVRLSRAMLETLAIVSYRQPVTRPEIDDIRGVDCGPVLKTLLDRGLVRIIGKKEEVGRPMLYGTTPEFLRLFNLRDLSELPTLREFYDLSAEDQSRVEAEHGAEPLAQTPSATTPKPDVALTRVARGALEPEPDDTDPLLDELDEASRSAKQALGELEPEAAEEPALDEAKAESSPKAETKPPTSAPPAGE